ncbi:unnamed protein product [Rotaria sp. Silwood2]|nr:unnamed protein product [Rotaria sp. Silwood2]
MKSNTVLTRMNMCRKWFGALWLLIEMNIASANIFGFAALFKVLPQYGIFDEYCHYFDGMNSTERDCSRQTHQYENAMTLGIIFFNVPSMFFGMIIDRFGCRFMKLVFHIVGWLSLALLKPGHDLLLFAHTFFTALSGIIVLITSYASSNYFSKSSPILLTLLIGSGSSSSIWYSIFQVIVDHNLLTLSQLSYIWMSLGALLFLSSFLFLDWKISILHLPYKFNDGSNQIPSTSKNIISKVIDTPCDTKWYTKIYQRIGLWQHLTNPLYVLNVLYLGFLMMPTILLSIIWYPWVYFLNGNDKAQADKYTFALNMSAVSQIVLCPIIGLLLAFGTHRGMY